jgi:hypothetical protein
LKNTTLSMIQINSSQLSKSNESPVFTGLLSFLHLTGSKGSHFTSFYSLCEKKKIDISVFKKEKNLKKCVLSDPIGLQAPKNAASDRVAFFFYPTLMRPYLENATLLNIFFQLNVFCICIINIFVFQRSNWRYY